MNTTTSSSRLHPALWIAAISVTALSFAGIAALTGWLPTHSSTPEASAPVAATAPAPVAASPASPTTPAVTAAPVPAPAHAPAKKKTAERAPVAVAALPPTGAGVPPDYVPPPTTAAAPSCPNCGVVANIREVAQEGKGSGLGAVAGGVAGAAIGNTIGHGDGRALATIAGAIGGGLLGNKIEKDQRKTVGYHITVRMEDGTEQAVESHTMPAWRVGDQVKVVNGGLVAR